MRFTVKEQIEIDAAGLTIVEGYRVDRDGQPVAFELTALDANILCEGCNVHEATGLTPSQLQARVAELEAALREALSLAEAEDGVVAESELWTHLLKWGCE